MTPDRFTPAWSANDNDRILELIPDHAYDPLLDYLLYGTPGGDFLTAVLSNQLVESFTLADSENKLCLWGWTLVLFDYLPYDCWGSKKKVDAWIEKRGLFKRKPTPEELT